MKKQLFHAAVLFLLVILTQLVSLPAAQATPGDFLFLWGAQQHFSDPSGVALDGNGNVFVTDTNFVQVFNSSGIRIRKWGSYGSGDGQFSYPKGIAVDKNGRVYVVDAGNNRIQVFDSAGNFLRKWSQNWSGNTIYGIAVDGNGNVYVTDTGSFSFVTFDYSNDSVKVFDSQGHFLRQLGSHGTGNGQFRGPTDIAVDVNNNVYVGDSGNSRVQMFSPAGNFIRIAVDYFTYKGLAVDQSGNVYAGGPLGGNPFGLVNVFDNAGNLIRELRFTDDYYVEHYWIPLAIAVDRAGNAYVLDSENDGLRAFDTAGNQLSQWWTYGTGDAQLNKPTGIAVDRSGNVYETNGDDPAAAVYNSKVRVFTADGKFLRKWIGDFKQTSGIAVDQGNNVFVLEPGSYDPSGETSSVQVFDSSGNPLRKWGSYGSDPGQFINPFGIAVARNGNVLVTDTGDSRVQIFDNAGNFLRLLGTVGTGNGQFVNPEGIAIDGSGNIFVVDSGNSRIQVFDSAHNFLRKWGSAGFYNGQFSLPSGIAIDANGNVFVADTGNNRIQVFNSTGTLLRKWGSEGDDNAHFKEPLGVTVAPSGARVYVADSGNNRIQVFTGYGVVTRYSISGTVRQGSATGPVLAGAAVAIAGKTATTSSTGSFSITDIPAGSYTLTISKTGYITKTTTGYVINSNKSGLVFYLSAAPKYSLSGTVRQGSATGAVLAGATVGIAGKTATTSSSGSFSITGILAGSYTLTISKTGYLSKTTTGYLVNSNKSGLVFYLSAAPRYSMSGTVRQGSMTGPVLAGATVAIAGKTATTSSTGYFSITGILADSYTLTISKTGYITKTTTGYVVSSNKSGLVFYLSAAPRYSMTGSVHQRGMTGP